MPKAKLLEYLKFKMPHVENLEVQNLQKGSYGASRETYFFDLSWEEDEARKEKSFVLRRDPVSGFEGANPRDIEFAILKSLEGSGVPAPKPFWFETDPEIMERPFLIMECVEGFVTPSFQVLGGANEQLREKIADDFVSILARIHNLDWRAQGFDFFAEPKDSEEFLKNLITNMENLLIGVRLEPDLLLTEAFLWLKSNMLTSGEVCLVHGDYKCDNIMYNEDQIVAVLDWEGTSLGDPYIDLGWVCLGFYTVDGLLNGLIEREKFLQRYQELSGRKINRELLNYWQIFANVRMAIICLVALQRWVTGGADKNVYAFLGMVLPKLHKEIIELLEL